MADKTLSALVGAGGGSIIGDVRALNVVDVDGLFVEGGDEWLRTGVVETDLASYPDAKQSTTVAGTFTGTSFSVSGESGNCQGIAWDGTFFWVVDSTNNSVYQYDSAGVYTGTSFSIAGEQTNGLGITFDGTDLWIVGNTPAAAHKYNTSGVYQSVTFAIAEDATPIGIAWDGTFFWVVGNTTDAVYKYDSAGVYQAVSFSVAGETTTPLDIEWDGANFWVNAGGGLNLSLKYDAAGSYTGTSFDFSAQDTAMSGITWDGANLWLCGNVSDAAFEYTGELTHVGLSGQSFDASTGVPMYVRIK